MLGAMVSHITNAVVNSAAIISHTSTVPGSASDHCSQEHIVCNEPDHRLFVTANFSPQ